LLVAPVPSHLSHSEPAPRRFSQTELDVRMRSSGRSIERIVHDIKQRGITTIIVEQNAVASLELANRVLILEMGHIVFDGSAKEVLEFRYEGDGCRQSVGARRDHARVDAIVATAV
jgi:ABC-type cobalamin transport system ATPase subunit